MNYYNNTLNQDTSFKAGLTPKINQEIQRADISEISARLTKKGIANNLRDNKIIAWCCNKTVEISEQINKQFGQKLSLPKGIYVEDFRNLRVENPLLLGICNLKLSALRKNSADAVPSRTVFFNSMHNWDDINAISDNQFAANHFSTGHFLYAFLHELAHASHEDRLLNKLGGKKLAKLLDDLSGNEQLKKYRETYGRTVRQICGYAENSPLDAIACDLPRKIITVLDDETLLPTRNPFVSTPYERLHFWERAPRDSNPLNRLLKNIWDGKFEDLFS